MVSKKKKVLDPMVSEVLCCSVGRHLQLHLLAVLKATHGPSSLDSIIVPVPKIKLPKTLNDFRPEALMSLVMKTFEMLVKDKLLGIRLFILLLSL